MANIKQKIYDRAKAERSDDIRKIINHPRKKKIVVAGPGTGKTYLFQQFLENKQGKALTLTFINALVDELSLSLFNLSEVRTLHGFALSILKDGGCKVFPKLPKVINEDYMILKGRDVNFKTLFYQDPIDQDLLNFYKDRKDYYGKYYGFGDIIYTLVKYFEKPSNIPPYDQIVVDEFQDFNEFEVRLIDSLASKIPILIAGDDDQSLYTTDFKKASPKYIRKKYLEDTEYKSFSLGYCSRSTDVIVNSVNDFIRTARKKGLLNGRVPKAYKYFPCEKMDEENKKHPKIIFRPVFKQFLEDFFIDEISNIAAIERKPFEILIIVPNTMKPARFPVVLKALRSAGFNNVSFSEKSEDNSTLIEGLDLLSKDYDNNLGWRIVAKIILKIDKFEELIKHTQIDADQNRKNIKDILDQDSLDLIQRLLTAFQRVVKEEDIDSDQLQEFLAYAGYKPQEIVLNKLKDDLRSIEPAPASMRGIKNIRITLTTIISSKGLSADYVFLMDFCDRCFADKNGITDSNVYDFIVTMTRARKRLYLISPDNREAQFLNWINSKNIDKYPPFLKKKFIKRK